MTAADPNGSRIERASRASEEMAEKYRNAPRYRDRTAGWPLSELQRAVVGMSRPPWWRLVARLRWRKAISRQFPSRGRRNERDGEENESKEDLK